MCINTVERIRVVWLPSLIHRGRTASLVLHYNLFALGDFTPICLNKIHWHKSSKSRHVFLIMVWPCLKNWFINPRPIPSPTSLEVQIDQDMTSDQKKKEKEKRKKKKRKKKRRKFKIIVCSNKAGKDSRTFMLQRGRYWYMEHIVGAPKVKFLCINFASLHLQ